MDSLKYWKPEPISGARNRMSRGQGLGLILRFAFSRLCVLFALMGISSLSIPHVAQAQAQGPTITITPSVTFYTEGDLNDITGTVGLTSPTPLANDLVVNIRLAYQPVQPGDGQTSTTVVFTAGQQNAAENFSISTPNDIVNIRQRTVVLTATAGAASDTANITQIDPRGVYLTDIAARTNESDASRGTTTFFDVSLVDPNNPSANLGEIRPTGNVFVTLRVAQPTNPEFSDEALIATDEQPIFQQEQVLIFTPQDFQQSQRVRVQGVDDNLVDGDQLFRVIVRAVNSNDAEYNNLTMPNGVTGVFGLNVDNEANPGPDIIINPNSIQTNENGSNGTFTVVLATQPTGDVTVNFQTSDPTEGRLVRKSDGALVTSTSITFSPDETADNGFSTPQTVTVRGIDDALADGNILYRIITTVSSSDPEYAAIDPADVAAVNNDNETPGLTVTPGFLVIFEGQSATITAVLNRQPTANVRFALRVDDPSEVQLNRTDVVFTPQNFNVPQTVTVTAINDNLVDGDRPFTVEFLDANSSDPNYNGRFGTDVTGTVVDTNSARVNIQPPGGLTTTEAGGTATFSLSLASMPQPGVNGAPDSTVTIVVTSSDTTEGLVSTGGGTPAGSVTLTFTRQNFSTPQTVTITGVDDLLRDGNVDYQINLDISGSSDANFAGLDLQPVTVTNNDDGESVGIVFSQLGGLVTTEAGGTATFTVQLTAQPTSNVTLGLSSSDTTEGTVSPTSIIFTPADFNQPRTVTVTGVNDALDDGDVVYNVVTAALITNDPTYKFNPQDIIVTNLDDDNRGITVTPTTGLVTTESGGKATFTVKLDSQPTDNVAIGISTPFTSEVSVAPATLLFTPQNYNVAQTVTVTGLDDQVIDGARTFVIVTSAANSTDPVYNGLNPGDVVGTNNDNDTARVVINPNPLVVREGEQADLFVRLSAQPTANVIVPLSLTPTDQAVLDKNQLTFTPQNFNIAQRVRVTGLTDGVNDGNQTVSLRAGTTVSSDSNFNGLNPTGSNATINVLDVVATAGVIITGPNTNIVSENGGIATFDVSLAAQPGSNVTINLSSSDTTEGVLRVGGQPATNNLQSLTFTPANFNTAQTVTVAGVNDPDDDGNVNFNIVVSKPISSDTNYSALAARNIGFINVDNDTAGFTITPYIGLRTSESGGTATFTVRLNSRPKANVTIALSTPFTNEISVSPTSLTFTSANFNTPQTVTVRGLDDQVIDGNRSWVVVTAPATSTDAQYNGLNPGNPAGTNIDNDSEGIVLTPTSQLVREGQTVTVSVRLLGTPTSNVIVPLSVNPTNQVVLDKNQLTFTPANANTPQIVRVTALADGTNDGNVPVTLTAGPPVSADQRFNGATATRTATITVLDVVANPAVNISTPSTTVLNESGTTATLDVTLSSQPAANVTINVTSSDTSEGTVTPTTLTFTPANFNTVQTVTVTGVDDPDDDGNVNFTVNFSKPVSTDPNYSALPARTVGFLNVDNDVAGFTVTPSTGNRLQTTEGGGTDTFTIRLNSRPKANVTITLSTPFTKEVSFTPTSLTFTPLNFNTAQTVTVRGLDDNVQDGNRSFVIVTNPATSTDAQYNGLNPGDVAGFNADDETFGYTVSPSIIIVEEGNTTTFTVRLNLAPTAPVRVPISSGDTTEARVNTSALIFTPQNFATPQTVTVTGVDDNLRDGDVQFTTANPLIVIGNAISSDPNYNGQFSRNLPGTVIDTDVPGVVVGAPAQITTTEAGGTATFTVALQTAPQGNNTVTINVLSSDTTEAVVAPATLTFDASNFDIAQTVTVTGVDDGIRDGDQNYRIVLRVATTSDPDYVGVLVPAVNGRNLDNGGAGILISPADGLTTDEAGATTSFDVRLINRPSNNVTVTLRSSDLTEGVLLQGDASSQPVTNNTLTLTFTSANFDTVQRVTVRGVDDSIVDGDINYAITSRLSSTDANFNLVGASALIVNLDNDTAGINVTPNLTPPATNFVLAEGSNGTFTVALTTQPTGRVVVRLRSTDTTEATVNYSAITFFPNAPTGTAPQGELFTQWNRPATVTITAVADGVVDGDHNWKIDISRDAGVTQDDFYKTVDPADVTGLTTDVNIAGVTVIGATSITTSETDVQTNTTVSFTVNLRSRPADNVVVPLSINDRTEAALRVPGSTGFALGGSLTFTPANFNVPQRVLVRGLNDALEDGDQPYLVVIGPTISRSAPFNGINPDDIAGVNKDDEDLTAPTVTITSPTDGSVLNFIQAINGTADDAASTGNGTTSGISTVKVRLFRLANTGLKQTAGYFNPATRTFDAGVEAAFDPAKHQITARYNAATKLFSALLPLTGTPPSLASGSYKVIARATDVKGNFSDSAAVSFVVDTIKPTVTITAPRAGTFSTPPQVQGVAQDNLGGTGIDAVFVRVFRAENPALGNTDGFLLPDGTFSDTEGPENLLPVVQEEPGAAGDVRFTFDLPALGAGQYTIGVVAQDVAGNITTTAGVTITLRNVSGAEDFLIGQSYLFSLPYANTAEAGATVRPNEAFNVSMFDPVTGDQRYLLSRFNPLTASYEILDDSALLRRGEGYLIKPLTANVRILRPTEDESRVPLNRTITTWTYTLRRNASASSTDPNNGFNLIGDPFHPDFFLSADWQNAIFFDGGNRYDGVAAAAAAGLIDSRLFTLNSATGAFEPTNGNLDVFEGYFVRTFKDNVQVQVQAVSATQ